MENKITTPRLAAMLAITTGKQKKLCEDFIKEFFRIVSDELAAGECVRVKGFGTFKLVEVEARKSVNVATGEEYEIPGHPKVMFVAAKELASAVNAPFDAFEAVEISDELPTDIFMSENVDDVITEEASAIDVEPEEKEKEVELIEESLEEESDDVASIEAYIRSQDNENDVESTASLESADACERDVDEMMEEDHSEESKPKKFIGGFAAGFLAAALIAGGVFFGLYSRGDSIINRSGNSDRNVEESRIPRHDAIESSDNISSYSASAGEMADSVGGSMPEKIAVAAVSNDDVPTVPSDRPVYDTVTTTRYLTIIAKEHYGNFNLWPIIYEENKAILGHPNRIKPGTRIVVPPLSKYGVDPGKKADVDMVKQKGIEIYKRFK